MLIQALRCMAIVVLLTVAAPMAEAQTLASSFEQLQVLVKSGDTVSVTDSAGREMSGRITSLSPSSLVLLVDGVQRDLSESEVGMVRQRRQDSLGNGAKWGLGIGAGLGLAAGLAIASEYSEARGAYIPILALVYGGIGAGVGAGMDALILSNQVIYFKPPRSSARVTVSPLVTPERKGVLFAFGF
jgi:ABC-type Fe3+-hydroxamate transport system substrate-binding protein